MGREVSPPGAEAGGNGRRWVCSGRWHVTSTEKKGQAGWEDLTTERALRAENGENVNANHGDDNR